MPSAEIRARSRAFRFGPLGIALLGLLAFAPSLAIGFRLDDVFQIERNPAVRTLDLGAIAAQGYWENVRDPGFGFDPRSDLWRPLTTLSVAVSHAIFGLRPLPYHAENLLLHAAASALVVVLLRRWRRSDGEALLAGALFAVAPVHIEPLGSVILRNELWAAVFGLGFLIFDAERRTVRASIAFALALLAKESAIALPLAALFARRAVAGASAREALRAALPAIAVALVYLVARFAVLGRLGIAVETAYFGPAVSTLEVWLTMARFTAEHYLPACLWGAPLVFDYSPQAFPTSSASDVVAWIELFLLGALAAGAAHVAWHRRAHAAFALTLFAVLLVPTSNLLTRIGVLGATRLLYLPYLGIAAAIAWSAVALWRRASDARLRRAVIAATLLALGLLTVQTARRLAVWIDDVDFYADICERAPRNALAQGMLGEARFARVAQAVSQRRSDAGEAVLAARAFAASIEVDPRNFLRLGRQLCMSSAMGEAERELLRGLDAAFRARRPSLPHLPDLRELESSRAGPHRAELAAWCAALLALRPSEPELAALPLGDRARFVNSQAFVEALALDQASCSVELQALRVAQRELERTSAATPSAPAEREKLRALCDEVERDARALVERTGAIATAGATEAPALRAYRADAQAVFAERYARFALACAQRAAALRARLA